MTGLDWTGLHLPKLDLNVAFSERQFILMDGTALPFTQQDCIVLDIALQIEIHRTVFKWAGMPGVDWTALHLTGLLQLDFMELGCSRWKYTAIYLHGWDFILEWTAVSGTRLDQTRQHCTGLL